MSRHIFTGHSGQTVHIGWDRPLATFFVQITRPHPTRKGETEVVVWQGTGDRELPTAASAITVAAAYGDLPSYLGAILETDRMRTLGKTDGPAQVAARYFRNNNGL